MMEHGIVTDVRYTDGVPVCSVQLLGRVDDEDNSVPVMRAHHGMFLVPKENQKVQLLKLHDQRFIVGILDRGADYDNPDLSEGEAAFQFDNGTKLSFEQNADGGFDIHVEASGTVYINGIDFDNHVHEYEDETVDDTSDGSGTASTATKLTTGAENP